MSRTQYKDTMYSYEIFDNGYDIYYNDIKNVTQRDPFGKPFDSSKSYEENCIMQIEQMLQPAPPTPPSMEEKNRADIDYIALMEDLDLPSYDIEEEGE